MTRILSNIFYFVFGYCIILFVTFSGLSFIMPSDHTHTGTIIPEVEVELEVEKDMLKQVADLTAFIIRSIILSFCM